MMSRFLRLVAVPALLLLLSTSAAAVVAQGSTDTSATGTQPVAIHQGTCADPIAEPAWDVEDATAIGPDSVNDDGTPVDADGNEITVVGTDATNPVLDASATVDVTFDDLSSQSYVIAVHKSPEEFDTLIACGEIEGSVVDGRLVIALAPVGNSGVSGVAILDDTDSGFWDLDDNQTHVAVYVVSQSSGTMATPAA